MFRNWFNSYSLKKLVWANQLLEMADFCTNRKKKEEGVIAQCIWENPLSHKPTTANLYSTALSKGFAISHTSLLAVSTEWIWGWFFQKEFPGKCHLWLIFLFSRNSESLHKRFSGGTHTEKWMCYFQTTLLLLSHHFMLFYSAIPIIFSLSDKSLRISSGD